MDKEKIKVAPPYMDRKSKQFEIVPSDGPCPRCFTRMSIKETEEGESYWCFNCGYQQRLPNNAAVV